MKKLRKFLLGFLFMAMIFAAFAFFAGTVVAAFFFFGPLCGVLTTMFWLCVFVGLDEAEQL